MQIIDFSVSNQILSAACPGRLVVSQTRGHLFAQVALDHEWDGLSVTAVFSNDFARKPYQRILTADPVEVPEEVLVPGRLFVSLVGLGDGGTVRLTTKRMDKPIIVYRAGDLIGLTPEETTPDLWEQAMSAIGRLDELQTSDKSSLVAAINAVFQSGGGGSVDPDAIAQAVADYMAAHPIQETDPTVPAWAKQPQKPMYTAAEVGALPDTYTPPVDASLSETSANPVQNKVVAGKLSEIEAIAKGRATGYVFDTESDMRAWIASNSSELNVGDNLYIRATNVPDYWWDGTSAQPLETQKVDLTEYAKKSEVPAVDNTLTKPGQAADAAEVGARLSSLSEEIANLQTSGLTTAQINALDGMFKVAAYDDSKDVSGAYAAFKAAFGLVDSGDTGGGGEETPDVTTYTITAELVNVTSSNSATSVTEGASYTATLTAADGYALDTVTVTMGGVDVTSDVYADGVISISSVTGNVKITASASEETVGAVLPEDGLLAFWDLRNATSTTDWTPTIGDAATYKLQSVNTYDAQTVDSHGVLLANFTYGGAKIQKADETGAFTDMEHGAVFTIVTMGYSPEDVAMIGTHVDRDINGHWYLRANYTNTEGADVLAKSVQTGVLAVGGTYCPEIYRVDGTQMSLHLYGTQWIDEDGSSYDSFDHWNDGPFTIRSVKNYPSAYLTAVAIYNRALTDVEVVEIGEYLKTLEVRT